MNLKGAYKVYKTIFHLDDEEKAQKLFNNVKNLLKDMEEAEEELMVEILANSRAIQIFRKNMKENKEAINNLLDNGVKIALCQNSLNGQSLTAKDMVNGAVIVRSGVGELTRKQADGWSYIKV